VTERLDLPLRGPKGEPVDFLRTIVSHGVAEPPPNRVDLAGRALALVQDDELAWCALGAGRMLRAPTVFEDVAKTICTTNTACRARAR
jgi:hypothetical protein